MTTTAFDIRTPSLLVDRDRLERNCARIRVATDRLGVRLRPHVKTTKSVEVALVAFGGSPGPITVSTLAEAEYFARAGFDDIMYAVGFAAPKASIVRDIQSRHGATVRLVVDHPDAVRDLASSDPGGTVPLDVLVEIDCGDHRGGVDPTSARFVSTAEAIEDAASLAVGGVMAHAGQSYEVDGLVAMREVAHAERDAAVGAAESLRAKGIECPLVSIGSTPTVLAAEDLTGVDEVRCGVYTFFDLDQHGRGLCDFDDLALSVLCTVIGHNSATGMLIVDAGGLAVSKDISARHWFPDVGYGYVCDARGVRIPGLVLAAVSQEHGRIPVESDGAFERYPIGTQLRIMPHHACYTAAAHDRYHVVSSGEPVDCWPRVNGWIPATDGEAR